MNIKVKKIAAFDEDLLRSVYEAINEPVAFFNPSFFLDEKNIFLVAFSEKAPCGFLYAYVLESPEKGYDEILLFSIDTFPGFQQQGVATKLIENLKNIARRQNCREIFVLTDRKNAAAIRLYEKTGGKEDGGDCMMFVYSLKP